MRKPGKKKKNPFEQIIRRYAFDGEGIPSEIKQEEKEDNKQEKQNHPKEVQHFCVFVRFAMDESGVAQTYGWKK